MSLSRLEETSLRRVTLVYRGTVQLVIKGFSGGSPDGRGSMGVSGAGGRGFDSGGTSAGMGGGFVSGAGLGTSFGSRGMGVSGSALKVVGSF